MKHDWECIKKPYLDKMADQDWRPTVGRPYNSFTYRNERAVTVPGTYLCRNCGYVQQANWPPPSDWVGIGDIPDCAIETARVVSEE